MKCDIFALAKNPNVRKQKDSIWCDVIAVLLPFVPKTWHFWAWEEKQIRGTDSFWVWEHLVFITATNLRWRRFGGDIKAGSINLYTAFRRRYSNDKEPQTESEEIEREYIRQWLIGPEPKIIICLCSDCVSACTASNIWSFSSHLLKTTGIQMRKKQRNCQFVISTFTCVHLCLFSGSVVSCGIIYLTPLCSPIFLFFGKLWNHQKVLEKHDATCTT